METQPKSFIRSRKLAYTLGTFLAALIVAVLPSIVDLEPETLDGLTEILPYLFVLGLAALVGHTGTDIMNIWREGVKAKSVENAASDLLELLFDILDAGDDEDEPDAPPVEVALGDVVHAP